MSVPLMPEARQQFLVKCASATIELMNRGVQPDDALAKVASENKLSGNEIRLVSHGVNHTATLAHLEAAKPEERSKVAPLTNADLVVQRVYGSTKDQDKEKTPTSKKAENPGGDPKDAGLLPAAVGRLKTAGLLDSYREDQNYILGAENEDHEAVLRASTPAVQPRYREEDPVLKIAAFERRVEAAGHEAEAAAMDVEQLLLKAASAFEPFTCPRYAVVQEAAERSGVSQDLLGVFDTMVPERHTRFSGQVKTAGVLNITDQEGRVLGLLKQAQDRFQTSIDARVAREMFAATAQDLLKQAGAGEDAVATDVAIKADGMGKTIGEFANPNELLHGNLEGGVPGLIQAVSGSAGGTKEVERINELVPPSLLNGEAKQGLSNHATSALMGHVLSDQYIGRHPIDQVVESFNRVRQINPKLGAPETIQLVRQDLAAGGVPLDTQLRARKATVPGPDHE